MKLLKLEFYKIKRRKTILTMCALMGILFLWCFWLFTRIDEPERASGWLNTLYTIPLLASVLMPAIMAVLASRLCDIEHKGNTYKQLKTLRSSGALFRAKALCGFLFILPLSVLYYVYLIVMGYKVGRFTGSPNVKYYAVSLLLYVACCFTLYLLQLLLSLLFFNQMIPLVVGLCGSMLGAILMYVEKYSFLPWGGFLSSDLVRMDWNETTREIAYYYREYTSVELCAVGFIFVWMAVFYFTGRILFAHKES